MARFTILTGAEIDCINRFANQVADEDMQEALDAELNGHDEALCATEKESALHNHYAYADKDLKWQQGVN